MRPNYHVEVTVRVIRIARAATALLIAYAAGMGLAIPAAAGTDVAVIAHRGSSGIAPENTAAAVKAAIKQDADFVEIDVQRTKDGKLVNFHASMRSVRPTPSWSS